MNRQVSVIAVDCEVIKPSTYHIDNREGSDEEK